MTVVFKENLPFLGQFFSSLECQTKKEFDVVVINDGLRDFSRIKCEFSSLRIIDLTYSNTPAKNREYGINWCVEHLYDIIIFGDSDDFFSPNRVELSIELLGSYDIVVNDLTLCDAEGDIIKEQYISHRIMNRSTIDFNFIKDKNIFGFSNTALKTKILGKIDIPNHSRAPDWFLFKKLLKQGNHAVFTNECITFYRQHSNNLLGLSLEEGDYTLWWERR